MFDLLVIETKMDASFPKSQFEINGFRHCCKDRNIHGGGVLIYSRRDIVYQRLVRLERNFSIEYFALKLRISMSWSTLIGIYKRSSLSKGVWKACEL